MQSSTKQDLCSGTLALGALLLASSVQAWGGCEHRRDLSETVDVSRSELLEVIAVAGDLEIVGTKGLKEARVNATVCASKEAWADNTRVDTQSGSTARIAVTMPDRSGFSWTGNQYLYVDLVLEVPADLELAVSDSSGDMDIRGTGFTRVKDSSGDIDIEGAAGVELEDSSGDIALVDIHGDVLVRHDSSGDIRGRDIHGAVVIEKDSSGDIRFRDVANDFLVERDSSGDIVADTVGGDFAVLRDGSGSVQHKNVAGSVRVPEDG